MEQKQSNNRFPEQEESAKLHGTYDDSGMKEKYLREAGKIEDYPAEDETPKMKSEPVNSGRNETISQTDVSGEEKKEDYINTDERQKDIDGTR